MYVLTQSMVYGRKSGLATTAGLMTGCLVHTTFLALGVSALVRQHPYLYTGIRYFGAAYLIYLAFRAYREEPQRPPGQQDAGPGKTPWQLYRQGFIMNVLNPKVTIFFLAFFPAFLFSDRIHIVAQFYVLGFLFVLVSFAVFATIALLAGTISGYMGKYPRFWILMKWLQVLVFISIAAYLLISHN